jgi:hypothetical protein
MIFKYSHCTGTLGDIESMCNKSISARHIFTLVIRGNINVPQLLEPSFCTVIISQISEFARGRSQTQRCDHLIQLKFRRKPEQEKSSL